MIGIGGHPIPHKFRQNRGAAPDHSRPVSDRGGDPLPPRLRAGLGGDTTPTDMLAPVVATLDLARKARALMRQNLGLSVLYNVFAVPLAMAGMLTPLIAAAAMSGSSILVTLNALRAGGAGRGPANGAAADLSSASPREAVASLDMAAR